MRELFFAVVRAGRFTPAASYQRVAYACAALLVLSGLFHLGVYVVDGGPWEGPVSWRKPVVFGLSFGIAVATISWFMTFLRPNRVVGWLVLGPYSLAAVGEVFLISMQVWRGVPSHFNDSTPFNETVFSYMGMLVTIIGVLTVAVTIWAWIHLDAPPSLALAIRLGLMLMLVSQGVGVQMIAEGGNTFGAAGVMKLPHAVTLHAAQVLPALAVLLLAAPGKELSRVRTVELGVTGYTALTGATLVQTYAGRAPTDLHLATFALALAGALMLVTAFVVAFHRLADSAEPIRRAHRHAGARTP
jgi:hypothetical protein